MPVATLLINQLNVSCGPQMHDPDVRDVMLQDSGRSSQGQGRHEHAQTQRLLAA